MDIKPQTTQPISDDQELAKVLAGVNDDANAAAAEPITTTPPLPTPPPVDEPEDIAEPVNTTAKAKASGDDSLDSVKNEALNELRPLVDKLNISPEEKFDTYLLLIRSTDDKDLIEPAHETAKLITDEARRAQALLDIIKEIDYFKNPQ